MLSFKSYAYQVFDCPLLLASQKDKNLLYSSFPFFLFYFILYISTSFRFQNKAILIVYFSLFLMDVIP